MTDAIRHVARFRVQVAGSHIAEDLVVLQVSGDDPANAQLTCTLADFAPLGYTPHVGDEFTLVWEHVRDPAPRCAVVAVRDLHAAC